MLVPAYHTKYLECDFPRNALQIVSSNTSVLGASSNRLHLIVFLIVIISTPNIFRYVILIIPLLSMNARSSMDTGQAELGFDFTRKLGSPSRPVCHAPIGPI